MRRQINAFSRINGRRVCAVLLQFDARRQLAVQHERCRAGIQRTADRIVEFDEIEHHHIDQRIDGFGIGMAHWHAQRERVAARLE